MVRLWDAATGKELSSLHGHAGGLVWVAFSPDGQRLASGVADGSVKVWEANVPAGDLERRAAEQIVADLFRQLGRKDAVLERLSTAPWLSSSRRREALEAARAWDAAPPEKSQEELK